MYFSNARLSSLASLTLFASAQASYLQSELSLGYNDKISPNLRAVPNFHITGNPNPPEILSNRIVLTPPAPGNQRGAIWSEKPMEFLLWTADIDFRATGPERGGGNLQIWYARDGQKEVGTSSIYTVGKFEGLALIVDQYAASGGYIRGFLNDGSTDYKSHHSVDSLAFGHCAYSYRNLGRPSRIQIVQTSTSLKVSVDSRTCFESDKIKLPLGYNLGISAASAENPDSFELFKLVTTTESLTPDIVDPNQNQNQNQNQQDQEQEPPQNPPPNQQPLRGPGRVPPPEPARNNDNQIYTPPPNYEAQFADLQNRLQNMMKHISTLNRDHNEFTKQMEKRNDDLMNVIRSLENRMADMKAMKEKTEEVLREVRQTKNELHRSFDRQVAGLRGDVRETKSSISTMSSGIGKFLLIVLGSQAMVVGAYLYYKRRKMFSPKKYL